MNMRPAVDIELIVYSFIQNLKDREKFGRFISVDISLNDPVTVSFEAEIKDELKNIDSAELIEWIGKYKEHARMHDMPFKDRYTVKFDL